MTRRPNVLLVTIDQWRGDSLGCAGHPVARTPNIDRLAARGVRFSRHFAQAAPCGPSRASLLTGTYLHVHRSVSNGTPLDARFANLATEMAVADYEPTLFGYTDSTVDPRTVSDPDDERLRTYEGILPGFRPEVYLPDHLESWGAWLRSRGVDAPAGRVREVMYRQRDETAGAERGSSWAPSVFDAEDSEAAFLTESFCDWVDRLPDDRPWFAHVTYIRPHPPYFAPAPWHDLIDPADVPMPVRHVDPETEGAEHPMVAGAMFVDQVRAPGDEREMRQLRATYWGMLAEVDHQFGRLLDHLDATGVSDDTIVVLTADHGDQMGDHWLIEKLGFFDQSYHVPLVVAGPVVAAEARGTTVDEFTEHVDVMPTILDLVGATPPAQCQGGLLRAFLEGRRPVRWRDAVHWEWDFRDVLAGDLGTGDVVVPASAASATLSVIRDAHGKYVHFADMPPAFYDLDVDPGELTNRADDPACRDRVLSYAQRLLSWRQATDDQTLTGQYVNEAGLRAGRLEPRFA
ncbi:MAG TPA: alkaline phosphatase family protein [Microthrixaceae bacterium]|nr:alkaline phosphatase family protein [Microthrixaceae bacterium]